MDPATQALCYFCRNTPVKSGVKPQLYRQIPQRIKKPRMKISTIKMVVKRFGREKQKRGRKAGWRKTTPQEDKAICARFEKQATAGGFG